MHEFVCRGLPASWINAWLAAIGVTVLDRRIRLSWTAEDAPVAVLSSLQIDPIEALLKSWPDAAFLADLPIAENWRDAGELKRKVSVDQFVARARKARGHPQAWALSSTMTDLSVDQNGEVAHAPFDPAGPGTTKWLHHRVLRVHQRVGPATRERLCASLAASADRVEDNGLGFDNTRLGSLADKSKPWIDPVVEFLAFFGMAILPMRGRGADRKLNRTVDPDQRQRGWRRTPAARGTNQSRRFVWPAWRQPLDTRGIDALLDVWNPWRQGTWTHLGVHAAWQSVNYQRRGSADNTRAIGAERL